MRARDIADQPPLKVTVHSGVVPGPRNCFVERTTSLIIRVLGQAKLAETVESPQEIKVLLIIMLLLDNIGFAITKETQS